MTLLGLLDLFRYLGIALVWVLAGCALLRAAGVRMPATQRWLVAPAATLALLAVTLGMTAVLLVPIRRVAALVWVLTGALAAVGLWREAREMSGSGRVDRESRAGWLLVATIALVVPTVLLLPYFVQGLGRYPGSAQPDGWSYAIYGAYLWDYPRMTEGGLSPGYQWAQHLSITRHVSASLLAWLAPVTHEGDTAAARGLLLALATFAIGSACAAVGRALGLSNRVALLAAIAAAGGNWIVNAMLVWNLDNLMVLAITPALATLAMEAGPGARAGMAVLAGLFVSSALYTYPEFSVLIIGGSALFFAGPLWRLPIRRSIAGLALCALTAAMLVAPYARELVQFFRIQLTVGGLKPPRAGEGAFAGLLDTTIQLPAIWGLGAESNIRPHPGLDVPVATLLSLLAVVGLVRLWRLRAIAPLVMLALLATAFSVFVWKHQYSYGAYKFVLQSWWLLALAVAFGVRECARIHPAVATIAAVIASSTFVVSASRSVRDVATPVQPGMEAFRAVTSVEGLANGAPVALLVENEVASHWASYFLRHSTIRLVASSGYLAAPHLHGSLIRATPVPWNSLRLVLTDARDPGPFVEAQDWKRLWRNRVFTLWDTGDRGWAAVWRVEGPYARGADLFEVGDTATILHAAANRPGLMTVRAGAGPAGAMPLASRLRVTDAAGAHCDHAIVSAEAWLRVALPAGDSVLRLTSAPAAETPAGPSSGPLMATLASPRVTFEAGRGVAGGNACPSSPAAAATP
jgi:hypothetical protein